VYGVQWPTCIKQGIQDSTSSPTSSQAALVWSLTVSEPCYLSSQHRPRCHLGAWLTYCIALACLLLVNAAPASPTILVPELHPRATVIKVAGPCIARQHRPHTSGTGVRVSEQLSLRLLDPVYQVTACPTLPGRVCGCRNVCHSSAGPCVSGQHLPHTSGTGVRVFRDFCRVLGAPQLPSTCVW
jgi:hypothetical protein